MRAIKMDNILKKLFEGRDTVDLVCGERRQFALDWDGGLITGRGIVGFFKPLPDSRMFINELDDGAFEMIPPEADFPGADTPRAIEVLQSMALYMPGAAAWFEAYQNAVTFKNSGRFEELICLNHLTSIEKYQYQIDTVTRVINDFRGRAILADEVGLGKTVEAGIAVTEYIMRGLVRNVLILTPASLVDQWYFEMKNFFNQDFIRADSPAFKHAGPGAWSEHRKIIASISAAKRKGASEHIAAIPYDMVIVDEAHHLKNRNSVAWQFVNSLNKKYMLLLSATPVQNSLEELYNLITLIRPGQLRTYSYFKEHFIADKSGLVVKDKTRLKELMAGAMIRHRRSDVDVKFTKRFAQTFNIGAAPRERALYENVSAFVRECNASGAMTRLQLKNLQERMGSCALAAKQSLLSILDGKDMDAPAKSKVEGFFTEASALAAEPSPKMEGLVKLIKDFGDQMIVFTKYRATQEALTLLLRRNGFDTAEFHGSMRRAEKEEQIQKFRDGARVLVSTETGGEGRNLQFCHGMINFDLPWNPMAIEQRIGRIHRIGQERDVYVYNLCSTDTVEQYILRILDQKINMFELAVGEMDMVLGDFDETSDFSDLVLDSWMRSETGEQMEQEMEALGERLLQNKQQLKRIKTLDNELFA